VRNRESLSGTHRFVRRTSEGEQRPVERSAMTNGNKHNVITSELHRPIHKESITKKTTPFSGGCACGAVRYESTAEPVLMLHCHCRDCQRSSGGPFSSFVIVPTEAFKLLQGSLRFHASPSEMGGKTRRGFALTAARRLRKTIARNVASNEKQIRQLVNEWAKAAGARNSKRSAQQDAAHNAWCPHLVL
jgi:hypothetical protein